MRPTAAHARSVKSLGVRSLAFLVVPVILLVAGCATVSQDGVPVPIEAPPASPEPSASASLTVPTAAGTNRYGAPKVRVPLDATKFLANPCAMLNDQQLSALNVNSPGNKGTNAVPNATGPGCVWSRSNTVTFLGIAFMVDNKNGLADFYLAHQSGNFGGYWVETTVDDYPAVFESASDDRADGVCDMVVGISETLAFRVNMQTRSNPKSCDVAKQAASFVRANLQRND